MNDILNGRGSSRKRTDMSEEYDTVTIPYSTTLSVYQFVSPKELAATHKTFEIPKDMFDYYIERFNRYDSDRRWYAEQATSLQRELDENQVKTKKYRELALGYACVARGLTDEAILGNCCSEEQCKHACENGDFCDMVIKAVDGDDS